MVAAGSHDVDRLSRRLDPQHAAPHSGGGADEFVQRFAAFFAVRRATLRALAWAPEMKRLVATSTDPCLRSQVEMARAG